MFFCKMWIEYTAHEWNWSHEINDKHYVIKGTRELNYNSLY